MRQPARPGCLKAARFFAMATGFLILIAGVSSVRLLAAGEPRPAEPARLHGLLSGDADRRSGKNQVGQQGDQRHILKQMVYRTHRREQRDLGQAVRELEAGNIVEGLAYLQHLLDLPEDGFVWIDSQPGPASVRREASRILGSLDAEDLELYEELYGPDARRLLRDAWRTGDPARYREIHRRFFHTAAGFAAGNWLASRSLDHGRFASAARIWSRLFSEPAHQKRVTATLLLKAAAAYRLSGQTQRSEALLKRIGEEHLRIAGRRTSPEAWLRDLVESQERRLAAADRQLPTDDWPVVMGDTHRNRSSNASTGHLRPVWSESYSQKPNGLSEQLLESWEEQRQRSSGPFAVANFAIVVGNSVLVRDFEGIRALDLSTGETVWSYQCESSLEKLAAATSSLTGASNLAASGSLVLVQRAYVWNSTMGMLASDGQRVYAVDGMDLALMNSRRQPSFDVRQISVTGELQPISRKMNHLIALEIDTRSSDGAVKKQPVWSVGGGQPIPEWFVGMDGNGDGIVTADEFRGLAEEFKKIDVNSDGAIHWLEAEAAASTEDRSQTLAGHFFLGPPLPVEGCLYAVTESDCQLNLVALRSETGELMWSQGIGFVGLPIDVDTGRYPLSCSPTFADGVVVCPTQLGMLVGVDALTGSLLWAHYCGDEPPTALGRSPYLARYSYGHPGFPNLPQIRNRKIVYMPRHSKFIHCVDLFTGRQIWKAERENPLVTGHSGAGDEYVAAVTDEAVMIVGGQHCRGLSLSTGEEQWSANLGMPAGRGIQIGTKYLLPLEEGRIATLDLSTGREAGFSLVRANGNPEAVSRLGNLAAAGSMIISAGLGQITALPQADQLLAQVRDRLASDPASIKDLLLASELELTLEDLAPAKSHLTAALALTMADEQRRRAETFMRELLYLELRSQGEDERAIFEQLDRYAKTPPERGRYLILRAESQMRHRDFQGILESTSEFAELDLKSPLPMAGDSARLVSAASWVPSVIGRVRDQFGDAELRSISTQVDVAQQAALVSGRIGRLEQFLAVYARWPQALAVRMELAQRLIDRGRFQQAELLLLENRRCGDQHTAAAATERLLCLWDRLGLHQEAAGLLLELEEQYGDVKLSDGRTGRQYVAEFPSERLTAAAYQRTKPPRWQVSRVNISEQRWTHTDPKLQESYQRNRGRFSSPLCSPFQLLYQGTSSSGKLAVVDRHSGVLVGSISIPKRNSNPSYSRKAYVGHFFPLGSPAAMNGISLLERDEEEPFWSSVPEKRPQQQDVMRVGPAGPSFCTFQARSYLVVVDPASGRILWQRTDLDPHSGLNSDRSIGLFGDEEVLVVVSSDHTTYTVYRTATGERLRHGKLDIDSRRPRYAFGRKLFYVHTSTVEKRLRCWDPLEDHIVLDEPLYEPRDGQIFTAATPDNEQLAVILKPGRIRILDGKTAATRLELRMEPAELANANLMWVFRDHARYYINLQRPVTVPQSPKYNYYDNQTYLPAARVRGDVYAVDRKSGKMLWKRAFPQRSVIQMPHFRLPFLITVSRQSYRDPRKRNQQSLLVEVIDAQTGQTMGIKENIFPDRILQLWYERDLGRLELTGLQTQIRLDFDRPRQCLLPDQGPL